MNYTKTNPFRLYQCMYIEHNASSWYDGEDRQKCNKCGWIVYIGLEDYYYRESINHNSTRADLHKHCFRTGGILTDQSGNGNKMWKRQKQ